MGYLSMPAGVGIHAYAALPNRKKEPPADYGTWTIGLSEIHNAIRAAGAVEKPVTVPAVGGSLIVNPLRVEQLIVVNAGCRNFTLSTGGLKINSVAATPRAGRVGLPYVAAKKQKATAVKTTMVVRLTFFMVESFQKCPSLRAVMVCQYLVFRPDNRRASLV